MSNSALLDAAEVLLELAADFPPNTASHMDEVARCIEALRQNSMDSVTLARLSGLRLRAEYVQTRAAYAASFYKGLGSVEPDFVVAYSPMGLEKAL